MDSHKHPVPECSMHHQEESGQECQWVGDAFSTAVERLVAAILRKGLSMLNASACLPRKNGVSLVHHMYGSAFYPEIEGAIKKLHDVINRFSKMKFEDSRSVLTKGLTRNLCSGPQGHPLE